MHPNKLKNQKYLDHIRASGDPLLNNSAHALLRDQQGRRLVSGEAFLEPSLNEASVGQFAPDDPDQLEGFLQSAAFVSVTFDKVIPISDLRTCGTGDNRHLHFSCGKAQAMPKANTNRNE